MATYKATDLLKLQSAGGVLESASLNIESLDGIVDKNDPDAVEILEASKAMVKARRAFEETIQRMNVKYKMAQE